jgi:hypothetical protein
MVITHPTQADGHAQPIVIEDQDSQDADEPPIPCAPLSRGISVTTDNTITIDDDSRTRVESGERNDGSITPTNSWDGTAGDAHIFDATIVAAYLEVDPQ